LATNDSNASIVKIQYSQEFSPKSFIRHQDSKSREGSKERESESKYYIIATDKKQAPLRERPSDSKKLASRKLNLLPKIGAKEDEVVNTNLLA